MGRTCDSQWSISSARISALNSAPRASQRRRGLPCRPSIGQQPNPRQSPIRPLALLRNESSRFRGWRPLQVGLIPRRLSWLPTQRGAIVCTCHSPRNSTASTVSARCGRLWESLIIIVHPAARRSWQPKLSKPAPTASFTNPSRQTRLAKWRSRQSPLLRLSAPSANRSTKPSAVYVLGLRITFS
jgi:hypothetical protein